MNRTLRTAGSILLLALVSGSLHAQPTADFTWEQLYGPHGGTVPMIVSDAGGNLFAGSGVNQHGLYRSTDGGFTWDQKSIGIALADRSVDSIVLADSGHILIGTGSHIGGRIYRSTNNGETWTESGMLSPASFERTPEGHILAANTGYGSMHRSTDNGYTWDQVDMPLGLTSDIVVNDSGHIFAGGWGFVRSKDGGSTWETLDNGIWGNVRSIAIDSQGRVYAGNWGEYQSQSGVFRSTDNGDSWSPLKLDFRVEANHNIVFTGEGHILVGSWGQGIWKSTDDGVNWVQVNIGLGHLYLRHMHVTAEGIVYAGTSGGGIYRSADEGETWQQVGLPVAVVNKLAISPATGDLFAAMYGVSRSSDSGVSWEPVNTGIGNMSVTSVAVGLDGTVFVGSAIPGYNAQPPPMVHRSVDHGESWVQKDSGIPRSSVQAMAVDTDGNVYAGCGDGVYMSEDNGDTWTRILEMGTVNHLVFNSAGDLFAGSWGQGIRRRLHGETTWTPISSGYVSSLFVASNGFVHSGGNRSEDNGDAWIQTDFRWNTPSAYAENTLGNLFAGTTNFGSGVYRSTNQFKTWEKVNTGIPTGDIRALAMDAEGYLYAAAFGYSVFKSTLPTTTSTAIEDDPTVPTDFALDQNFPNPFNPDTQIVFELPHSVNVSLSVYNLLGERVRVLADGIQPAGRHEVTFQGRDLPSGVYICALEAGGKVQVRKMVLLK